MTITEPATLITDWLLAAQGVVDAALKARLGGALRGEGTMLEERGPCAAGLLTPEGWLERWRRRHRGTGTGHAQGRGTGTGQAQGRGTGTGQAQAPIGIRRTHRRISGRAAAG